MQTVNSWSVPAITLNLTIIDELLWPLLKKLDGVAPFITDPTSANSTNILCRQAIPPLPHFLKGNSDPTLYDPNVIVSGGE